MNLVYFLLFSLIYFSTNSENKIIHNVKSDEFDENDIDISNDNVHFPMTLLYGKNDSDFVQIGGTNSSITQNFTIKISHYYYKKNFLGFRYSEMAIIVVIELLKTRPDEICHLKNDIFIHHISEYKFGKRPFITQVCNKLTYTDKDKAYGKYVNVIDDAILLLHVNLNNFSGTVKITATSTRENTKIKCRDNSEISCDINRKTWCLNKSLECNGQLNCGDRIQSDENPEICHRYSREVMAMALYGMIMVIIVLFILVQVLRIFLYYTPQLPRLSLSSKDNILLLDLESQSLPPPQYSETFIKRNLEMIHRINDAKSLMEHNNNLEKKNRQKFV